MLLFYTEFNNNKCSEAREYLDFNEIEYKEINISVDRKSREYWHNLGIYTVPILREEEDEWVLPIWDQDIFEYLMFYKG